MITVPQKIDISCALDYAVLPAWIQYRQTCNEISFESAFYSNPDLRDVRPPPESNSGFDLKALVAELQSNPALATKLSQLLSGQNPESPYQQNHSYYQQTIKNSSSPNQQIYANIHFRNQAACHDRGLMQESKKNAEPLQIQRLWHDN